MVRNELMWCHRMTQWCNDDIITPLSSRLPDQPYSGLSLVEESLPHSTTISSAHLSFMCTSTPVIYQRHLHSLPSVHPGLTCPPSAEIDVVTQGQVFAHTSLSLHCLISASFLWPQRLCQPTAMSDVQTQPPQLVDRKGKLCLAVTPLIALLHEKVGLQHEA